MDKKDLEKEIQVILQEFLLFHFEATSSTVLGHNAQLLIPELETFLVC